MRSPSILARLWTLAVVLSAVACGEAPPAVDGGQPDSGQLCASDAICDDGEFCNGAERCMPSATGADARGCVAATEPRCMATQTCDETADACLTECDLEPDADGDGVDAAACGGTDCDDADAMRYPGNAEVCDAEAHDEDCSDTTLGDRDVDGDGAIDAACCNGTTCGEDCDDFRVDVGPTGTEVCNAQDDDCDGSFDETVLVAGFVDADRDGHGDPTMPTMSCPGTAEFSTSDLDCDDASRLRHGALPEVCDGIDNDCSGVPDDNTVNGPWFVDADGDGFGDPGVPFVMSCAPPAGRVLLGTDCDDDDPMRSPGAPELCNGLDDDCNGRADYAIAPGDGEDDDHDGVPDALCAATARDCADRDPLSYPGAVELCDGRDNDCDGMRDEDLGMVPWRTDADGDGYGRESDTGILSCTPLVGRSPRGGDCADTDRARNPEALDDCSGRPSVDDDCDGTADEDQIPLPYYTDADGDLWGVGTPVLACIPPTGRTTLLGDCDDAAMSRNPDATQSCAVTSTTDEDCDGLVGCEDPDCAGTAGCATTYRLVLVSGGGQTAPVASSLPMPIVIRVEDLAGAPQAGHNVTFATSGGAGTATATLMSNGAGVAAFTVRVGLVAGTETIRFSSPGAAPITVMATATAAAAGTIFPIANASRTTTASGAVPNASTFVSLRSVGDVVVATDGTMYVSEPAGNRVLRITSAGRATLFAGTGTSGFDGDFGPATSALLSQPHGLALDETNGRLYIADSNNDRVRVVDLATGTISTAAGGVAVGAPTYGDGSTATGAHLDNPRHVAIDPTDGALIVADNGHNRIRRVDATTSLISTILGAATPSCSSTSPLRIDYCSADGCALAFDADDNLYVGARMSGQGACNTYAVARHVRGTDELVAIAGTGALTTEGAPARLSSLGEVRDLAADPVGNVFYADGNAHRVRRVDRTTGLVTTVAGTGTATSTGDFGAASSATVNAPSALAFAATGDLLLGERASGVVRAIRAAASSMRTPVTFAIASGDMQTGVIGSTMTMPITVRARTGTTDLQGIDVEFARVTRGAAPEAVSATTNAGGTAGISARVDTAPGAYQWEASAFDIAGAPLPGSPLTLTATATAPAAGTMLTLLNASRTAGAATGVPGPSIPARSGTIWSVAAGSDGTLYASDWQYHFVYRIAPEGYVEILAGTGTAGSTGDLGPATAARLNRPTGLALADADRLLYVAEETGDRVRVIDLDTGVIDLFAGSGSAAGPGYGDGDVATMANLSSPGHLSIGTDGALYIADTGHERIRRVDRTTNLISTKLGVVGSCTVSTPVFFAGCATMADCSMAWDASGNLYVSTDYLQGSAANGACGWNASGIIRVATDGTLTHVAGQRLGMATAGMPATMTHLSAARGLLLHAGSLYYADASPTRQMLRRIDLGTGLVSDVAGGATAGSTGDYGPASAALLNYPLVLAVWNGHIAISETTNNDVRVIW